MPDSPLPAPPMDGSALQRLLPDFVPLPEDPDNYFTQVSEAISIPLQQLIPIRTRPEGVRRAAELMRQAAAGIVARRAPIRVLRQGDTWQILDGNSTFAIALLSGWQSLPCLESADSGPDSERIGAIRQ